MSLRDGEGIPMFGSAAQVHRDFVPGKKVSRDEEEMSTLQQVHTTLQEAVHGLYKDFNAFKLTENVPKTTAIFDLMKQIESKQMAYDVLAPCLEAVESAMRIVNEKYKEN